MFTKEPHVFDLGQRPAATQEAWLAALHSECKAGLRGAEITYLAWSLLDEKKSSGELPCDRLSDLAVDLGVCAQKAYESGQIKLCQTLIDGGANTTNLLIDVIYEHDGIDRLDLLLREINLPITPHRSGVNWKGTPVAAAVRKGRPKMLKTLLSAGADPNEADGVAFSQLYDHANGGGANVKMFQMLVDAGGTPERFPLLKFYIGDPHAGYMVDMLLERGSDPNQANGEPMVHAAKARNIPDTRRLLAAGGDININQGAPLSAALGLAAKPFEKQWIEFVAYLLQQGADVRALPMPTTGKRRVYPEAINKIGKDCVELKAMLEAAWTMQTLTHTADTGKSAVKRVPSPKDRL